ncbi:hypothetical protein SAMN05421640_2805 [Ekhidna lutea]|uniref:Uncharacterized protein n=1 Tax=Ekhidna lutea TaxID=447679 RepID=A0A239KP41_EKHLU|nr:hypothetical protein [Ekhidna lutea]SNT19835.1 hypothetical protein SAMN05421640_2805 [Ekhidna lutea]
MSKKEKARVHKDLDGLELNVDSFGEISSNMPIDQLNKFLNKNVEDKKLKDRDDLDKLKKD